jgi:hypothetical protein
MEWDMNPFIWKQELGRKGHKVLFSGLPFAMHCHHYNINLQKTLEDTLGDEGVQLLYNSAEEANYENFINLFMQYPMIKTHKSKIEMATTMFQNYGLGVLHFQEITAESGRVLSQSSHHVTGWLAKHGRRDNPGCHFSRGWIAGFLEAVYDHPLGHYRVVERRCKLMRDTACEFIVDVEPGTADRSLVFSGANHGD